MAEENRTNGKNTKLKENSIIHNRPKVGARQMFMER